MSEHPVDDLAPRHFDDWAIIAAENLRRLGHAYVSLEPGDATRYQISVVMTRQGRYMLATSFGPLYEFNPQGGYDWGYVLTHWLPHCQASYAEHTARVLARFLNTLADKMKGN